VGNEGGMGGVGWGETGREGGGGWGAGLGDAGEEEHVVRMEEGGRAKEKEGRRWKRGNRGARTGICGGQQGPYEGKQKERW